MTTEPKFICKIKNKRGLFEDYSGRFDTLEKLNSWYQKHGIVLQEKFKLTMVFFHGDKLLCNVS